MDFTGPAQDKTLKKRKIGLFGRLTGGENRRRAELCCLRRWDNSSPEQEKDAGACNRTDEDGRCRSSKKEGKKDVRV